MINRLKKRFDRTKKAIPIFHGTDRELRPEDFDFTRAGEDNDFGKAMYFGLTVKMARNWASIKKNGVVNWYLFKSQDALEDSLIQITLLEDPMQWLETILRIYDSRYAGKSDVIIGDTMDAHTGRVIDHYRDIASSKGILMSDFDEETKRQMIADLNPEYFGQQIAFRTKEGLKHVKFIGSMEVAEMDSSWDTDPSVVASRVADMLMQQDGLSQDEALVAFMRSDTFRRLLADRSLCGLPTERILEMYRREVR